MIDQERIKDALKEAVAPDLSTREKLKTALHDHSIHIVIVIVSSIVIFIPPLCAGALQGDIKIFFPKTSEGWFLWILTNSFSAIGNLSLLALFKMQAKRNVRDNENFKKANEIVRSLIKDKYVYTPRSPTKMNRQEYIKKGVFVVIATLSSFLVISSIMINFDVVTLISTLLSASIALALSWITMLNNEEYWTEEYLLWAQSVKDKFQKEDQHDQNRQ